MRGKVADAATHSPIEGAIVVAIWRGYGGHSKVCFHTENAITDKDGQYIIPAWKNTGHTSSVTYQEVRISSVYKNRYRLAPTKTHGEDGNYYLEVDRSSNSERIKYLLSAAKACFVIRDGSENNAWPLLKEIYLEAVELAETKADQKNIVWIVKAMYGLSNDKSIYMNYEESIRYANDEIERREKGRDGVWRIQNM